MDTNAALWARLRSKGFSVDDLYVQAGVGPLNARMHVVINGVAMPYGDAYALDRGLVTLVQIAEHRSSPTSASVS